MLNPLNFFTKFLKSTNQRELDRMRGRQHEQEVRLAALQHGVLLPLPISVTMQCVMSPL